MARNRDKEIAQKNDATMINNKRKMARKAKTKSNKRDRQNLKKDMEDNI